MRANDMYNDTNNFRPILKDGFILLGSPIACLCRDAADNSSVNV